MFKESSTAGQVRSTVFIELQPVVEANNRLLLAQSDVDREVDGSW